ncbi:MAG: glycoside hydrolase family 13 protein, partial [Clostridia bacterium]|nr:glycoside hydrolase family 13 protein [Clostridia bacterium]
MSITIFDSRNARYRSPFGAVAEGTQIHFRLCLPRYIGCSAATLRIHNELTGEDEIGNMFWCGMEGNDAEWWEVDYTPATASLYFYWFELSAQSSARTVSRTWGGKGEFSSECSPWQLTVYEKGFKTPDWLDG